MFKIRMFRSHYVANTSIQKMAVDQKSSSFALLTADGNIYFGQPRNKLLKNIKTLNEASN